MLKFTYEVLVFVDNSAANIFNELAIANSPPPIKPVIIKTMLKINILFDFILFSLIFDKNKTTNKLWS